MGKIIVIDGTDCSGKETQAKRLFERLIDANKKVVMYSFPMYDTPTGMIVGGPYLGKKHISTGWFKEGANNVNPKVASLYYAADRLYNVEKIKKRLEQDYIVILDRYVTSNMGHQAGKIKDKEERMKMYRWLEKLEYDLLELPKPDISIFLHMPYEFSKILQGNRVELDEHETSVDNITGAELTYQEMSELYNFITIECVKDNKLKTIDEISNELYDKIIDIL